MLAIKKVYIDTRFKTSESKSDSDFFVELPMTVNIPDRCVCYIDDIVIPVSWTSVNEKNNNIYMRVQVGESYVLLSDIIMEIGNYSGTSFAVEFKRVVNLTLNPLSLSLDVTYDVRNNKLKFLFSDDRANQTGGSNLVILADSEVLFDGLSPATANSINSALRLQKSVEIRPGIPYYSYLDLHTVRNLYLSSSSLGSFNTISNFGSDVIIKKIPVRADYNEMLFDNSESGYDYLEVSKRSLRRIDFRLQDSSGNTINLNNNHWSFSLVFQLLG